MTYQTPELVQVGSAAAVVLGVVSGLPTDNVIRPTSDGGGLLGLDE